MLKKFISQRTSKLCNKLFYLSIFSVLYMRHLLYLIFLCDFDVRKFGETSGWLTRFEILTTAIPFIKF